MAERKFVVVLTEGQSINYTRIDHPERELFDIAREQIGCEWIEVIEPDGFDGYVLLIDEEGKMKGNTCINCIASCLYGSHRHGDPVVGNAVVVKTAGEELQLLTSDEAAALTFSFKSMRDAAIRDIRKAFHIR